MMTVLRLNSQSTDYAETASAAQHLFHLKPWEGLLCKAKILQDAGR